jgi:hypothetical protein
MPFLRSGEAPSSPLLVFLPKQGYPPDCRTPAIVRAILDAAKHIEGWLSPFKRSDVRVQSSYSLWLLLRCQSRS